MRILLKMNGKELKKIREKLHLTQEDFARKLDINLRTYQNWEASDNLKPAQKSTIENYLYNTKNSDFLPENQNQMKIQNLLDTINTQQKYIDKLLSIIDKQQDTISTLSQKGTII